jgi:hypothetical protein
MNNDRIHMQDQVSNQVEGIMNFYKKKPSKASFFCNFSLLNVLIMVSALFLIIAQVI